MSQIQTFPRLLSLIHQQITRILIRPLLNLGRSLPPRGLLDEINARLLDKMRPFQWESLKPRYLKLVEAVPNNRFDDFVMKLAENLPSEESKEFLKWVDRWRGTKLSSYKRNELPRGYKGKFVDDEAQAFVEENQSLEPDW